MSKEPKSTPVVTVEEVKKESQTDSTNNPSSESRNFALLAHICGIFFGFIPALVIMLVKTEDKFAKEEATEALNFQITVMLAYVVAGILSLVLIGLLIMPLIFIVNLIFCILAAVDNSNGKSYKYPFSLRLIK